MPAHDAVDDDRGAHADTASRDRRRRPERQAGVGAEEGTHAGGTVAEEVGVEARARQYLLIVHETRPPGVELRGGGRPRPQRASGPGSCAATAAGKASRSVAEDTAPQSRSRPGRRRPSRAPPPGAVPPPHDGSRRDSRPCRPRSRARRASATRGRRRDRGRRASPGCRRARSASASHVRDARDRARRRPRARSRPGSRAARRRRRAGPPRAGCGRGTGRDGDGVQDRSASSRRRGAAGTISGRSQVARRGCRGGRHRAHRGD